MDAHALHRQGWTISAIARHTGHDRKTIRAYLFGGRVAGERKSTVPDPLEPFLPYLRQRLTDDPHVWATVLFDEVVDLGFDRSYPIFTRGLRAHQLRPHCEPCSASKGRDHAVIDHPAGEETQWDWVELPDPPASWGLPGAAHLLVGSLPHSGKWRGVLAESEDQAHLIEALHAVAGRLGGLTKVWRFDRMATVCDRATGRISKSFAAVAKHYGVQVRLCPPNHGNRKGSVEKSNHSAAQRWWRTVPDDTTVEQAQQSLDRLCARVGDARPRRRDGQRLTVAQLADLEPLAPLPPAFPANASVARVVSSQAMVAFRGNFYSVPPGLAKATVTVTHRLGDPHLDITTASGVVIARHRRELDGAGVMVRDTVHVTALETAVLAQFHDGRPCKTKTRKPPSPTALAHAQTLRDARAGIDDRDVVIDLQTYAAAAADRQVAP